jgi:formylmethanofuran dehydrogenase subunit C
MQKMALKLSLKRDLCVPVDAQCISPEVFSGKTTEEIARLPLWEGNRKRPLGDVFKVEGSCGKEPSEVTIDIVGNLSRIHRIGSGMTDGEISVQGSVGMHLGEEMKGGRITIGGDAGSWAGSAMKGGIIEVENSCGDYIGAAYRGSTKGMRGGSITIHGNAGSEVGRFMRKGVIRILGDVGQFVGIHMKKGEIVVQGDAGERAGAYMTGGKIVLCGHIASVLPTFTFDNIKSKAKAEGQEIKGPFYMFVGDLTERGSGKLYVSKDRNQYLKNFEELTQ